MDSINSDNSKIDNEPQPFVLYLVGTPIGNLNDISDRAKNILKNVSLIACEDTRRSSVLLKSFKAKTKLISFHKHNTKSRLMYIKERLNEGKSIALISDAGMPSICDPGEELVKFVKDNGYKVISIPGPCAATTALISSGFDSQRFCFEGFLPIKRKKRLEILREISTEKKTIIIYESPHKLIELLKDLYDICDANRLIHISRELTKKFEENITTTLEKAIEIYKKEKPRGEFTIVLKGFEEKKDLEIKSDYLLSQANNLTSKGYSLSDAIKKISKETGHPKRLIYSLLHKNL